MTTELLLSLLGLALVDSLSAGTLLIPIFFLLAPGRIRLGRMLTYLGTIAGFYFLVGLALTAGASVLLDSAAAVLETPAAYAVQLVLGAVLLAVAILMPTKKKDPQLSTAEVAPAGSGVPPARRNPQSEPAPAAPGRLGRWRERALGGGSPATVIVLALAAGLVELATMIPYLAAVGLLTNSGLGVAGSAPLLAAYCVVMIVPALLLLLGRVAARRTVEPRLRRLSDWLSRNAAENTAWIIGIVGFLLLRDALSHSAGFEFWPFNS
ncbi:MULTISPECIES: GAP family protein [unclassified Pseudoclavibacter]|uniref:GAP family protein n=1 Tax=unclassified Pseudoclavibacter TaxID=2615177 RepID=UPI001BA72F43|nr:GAP family protein [Pseudoclavibacter sp. Marseille-Q4354]MBS3178239.1 GAP family protein [Pseudoclavibacter sp. Marseille-Q4354]